MLRRCFLCLAAEHMSRDCPHPKRCGKCGGMHHDLLHLDGFGPQSKPVRSNFGAEFEFEADDPSHSHLPSEHHAAPTMVTQPGVPDSAEYSLRFTNAKIGRPGGGQLLEENILCDDGSNITLIDEHIALELGLTGDRFETR